MKSLKPYLKSHATGKEAVERTTKKNVIAVMVKTYMQDSLHSTEFYSYKTNGMLQDTGDGFNLAEDFPLTIHSNQSIQEIDANDY